MRSRTLWAIGGILAAFIFCCAFLLASKKVKSTDGQKNWTLIWSDEFDGTTLDLTKWTPETSCWGGGNNEHQCYTDRFENVNVSAGVLKIRAKPETFTDLQYPRDWAERGERITRNYTSGKIRTKGLASWTYGRFEARIKLPLGQSTWPAFWMLPDNNSYGEWPLSGEIDIMEGVNLGAKCDNCKYSKTENRSSAAAHFGKLWPDNEFRAKAHVLPNGPESYHIYALEWAEGRIDWFVNEEKIFTMTQADWFTGGMSKSENQFAPFDQPFYLMINLAVGGSLPDNRNEKAFNPASFPSEMLVDWVRVYQCKSDIKTSKKCLSKLRNVSQK